MTEEIETSEEVEEAPVDRCCGIPRQDLLNFLNDLKLAGERELARRFRGFKSTMTTTQNGWDRERALLLKSQGAMSGRGGQAAVKLAATLKDIEGSGATDEEQRALKLRAFVESMDLVQLRASLHQALSEGKTDAMKLVVNLIGLLDEKEQPTAAPVFNFQVFVRGEEQKDLRLIEG